MTSKCLELGVKPQRQEAQLREWVLVGVRPTEQRPTCWESLLTVQVRDDSGRVSYVPSCRGHEEALLYESGTKTITEGHTAHPVPAFSAGARA